MSRYVKPHWITGLLFNACAVPLIWLLYVEFEHPELGWYAAALALKCLPIFATIMWLHVQRHRYSQVLIAGLLFSLIGDTYLQLRFTPSAHLLFIDIGIVLLMLAHGCFAIASAAVMKRSVWTSIVILIVALACIRGYAPATDPTGFKLVYAALCLVMIMQAHYLLEGSNLSERDHMWSTPVVPLFAVTWLTLELAGEKEMFYTLPMAGYWALQWTIVVMTTNINDWESSKRQL